MANQQLYGQRGFSSIYNYNTTTTTPTNRSTIDSTTYLPDFSLLSSSSRYLSTYSNPYSLSTDPTPPSTFEDPLRSSSNISGALAAPASGSFLTTATSSTPIWPSFDVSSSLTKRPSEALYNKSVVGAHMPGQSEAWLAFDCLAKRPRIESASNLPIYPQRPGEKDCIHYMLTRTCKYGDKCKFDHPIWVPEGGISDWKELPSVPSESYPERPGEPDCLYFLKTEKCKFGLNCKYNHPKDKLAASGNASVLPDRPSEPLCTFYMKTRICKFGEACKFHHPKNIQIPLGGQEAGNLEKNSSVPNAVAINDVNSVKNQISGPALSYNSKGLPIRLGEMDCPFYIKTGSCKYGANCRYSHPDRNELLSPFSVINPPAATIGHSVLTSSVANLNAGLLNPAASILQSLAQTTIGPGYPAIYPQRPGQIECDYYMKTGECKFGEKCKFHHPIDRSAPKLTLAGLPRREGVSHCPYYMKTGACRYGVSCKFDHPPPGEVMAVAASKETPSTVEEGKRNGEEVNEEEEKKEGEKVFEVEEEKDTSSKQQCEE